MEEILLQIHPQKVTAETTISDTQGRIAYLRAQHATLDRQLRELSHCAGACSLEVSRLKKEKLAVKDELARLGGHTCRKRQH